MRLAALGAACAVALAAAGQVCATAPAPVPARLQALARSKAIIHLAAVQAACLTHCGGCHGIEGTSAPRSVPTLRVSPAEVAQLRERPLTGPGLRAYRVAVVNHLASRCPVPPGLRVYDK